MNRYAVTSVILRSMLVIHPNESGGKIKYQSILPAAFDGKVCGSDVQLRGYDGPMQFPDKVDPRTLTVHVVAASNLEAAELALEATEWTTDYLAFSFLSPIRIVNQSIENLDTGDRNMGEPMDVPKFRRTDVHIEFVFEDQFVLPDRSATFSENERAALRWYHKGLETPYDVDRFIFFGIALEILAKVGVPELVATPFRHRCGHEIHVCPGCKESLARHPTGEAARVEQFMQSLGVPVSEIKPVRQFREIVHGKGRLTLAGLSEISCVSR